MYNFKFFVSVGAVMAFFFTPDNEVTASPAPAPHPCLWMLKYDHGHPEPTTTTTAKPDVVEEFAKLKNKKTMEKLITDWILWGPSSEGQKSNSKNAVERMISGYMKFLANLFMF